MFLQFDLQVFGKGASDSTEIEKIKQIRNDCYAYLESISCLDNDFKATQAKVRSKAKNLFGGDVEYEVRGIEVLP